MLLVSSELWPALRGQQRSQGAADPAKRNVFELIRVAGRGAFTTILPKLLLPDYNQSLTPSGHGGSEGQTGMFVLKQTQLD